MVDMKKDEKDVETSGGSYKWLSNGVGGITKCEATDEFPRISWVERYENLRKKTELARCQNLREVSEF